MAFILVFRPHQRPAWADIFDSEFELASCWCNGEFARSCFAPGPGPESEESFASAIDRATYEAAIEQIGHDLSNLTRLDSAEEVARYCAEDGYMGGHNKGLPAVMEEARRLGWVEEEEEEEDE
jgi:hypothetical protein